MALTGSFITYGAGQLVSGVLALSTGCMQCETCAYPNAPCRHPDKRVATVESHGILLMQTVEAMNICFNYGNDTVTYFTLLLFNA